MLFPSLLWNQNKEFKVIEEWRNDSWFSYARPIGIMNLRLSSHIYFLLTISRFRYQIENQPDVKLFYLEILAFEILVENVALVSLLQKIADCG